MSNMSNEKPLKEFHKLVSDSLKEENEKTAKIFTFISAIFTASLFLIGLTANTEDYKILIVPIVLLVMMLLIPLILTTLSFFDILLHPVGVGRLFWAPILIINKLIIKTDDIQAKELLFLKDSLEIKKGQIDKYYSFYEDKETFMSKILGQTT